MNSTVFFSKRITRTCIDELNIKVRHKHRLFHLLLPVTDRRVLKMTHRTIIEPMEISFGIRMLLMNHWTP